MTFPYVPPTQFYYLYLREYLRMKDPNEYTGQESYVSSIISQGSIAYVPIGKALAIGRGIKHSGGRWFGTNKHGKGK